MGKFLKIKEITRPDDNHILEYIDKPHAITAALFNNNYTKVLLVKQFRVGAAGQVLLSAENTNIKLKEEDGMIYELPAGIIDPGETPLTAMFRELEEETGFKQEDIIDVNSFGSMYVSPGYTTECIHLFSARISNNAKQHELQLDPNEKLIPEWIDIDKVNELTKDMKTILCLNKALNIPKLRIGLLGGTFNPIQNLHLTSIERCLEELQLDECIIEPVGDKYIKKDIISIKYRMEMLKLAIEDNPKLKIGSFEMQQFTQPNTIDTLRYYKQLYGNADIFFITGSDNLKEMSSWPNYDKILEEFNIICIQRNNDNIYQDIILKDKHMIKNKNHIHIIYENVVNNISSSAIRNLVKSNMSIKYMTPSKVEKYIKENNLYK